MRREAEKESTGEEEGEGEGGTMWGQSGEKCREFKGIHPTRLSE